MKRAMGAIALMTLWLTILYSFLTLDFDNYDFAVFNLDFRLISSA